MKASCPKTVNHPRFLMRRFRKVRRDSGCSIITARSGKRRARYVAVIRPDSPWAVSSTTRRSAIPHLIGYRRHRHRPHTCPLLQDGIMIKDSREERKVRFKIHAKIVRVPPEMEHQVLAGGFIHRREDAAQAQVF